MISETSAMDTVINQLSKKGFRVNKMGKDCGEDVCYMSRKRGATTNYAEVNHIGNVNGTPLSKFLERL